MLGIVGQKRLGRYRGFAVAAVLATVAGLGVLLVVATRTADIESVSDSLPNMSRVETPSGRPIATIFGLSGSELVVQTGGDENGYGAIDLESGVFRELPPPDPASAGVLVASPIPSGLMIVASGRPRIVAPGAVALNRLDGLWTVLAQPPLGLDPEMAIAALGEEIVVVTKDAAVAYRVSLDSWSLMEPPGVRLGMRSTALVSAGVLSIWPHVNTPSTPLVYDDESDSWRQLPTVPVDLRRQQAVSYRETIVVWGVEATASIASYRGFQLLPNATEWISLPVVPAEFSEAEDATQTIGSNGDRLFVVTSDGAQASERPTVWELSAAGDWTALAAVPGVLVFPQIVGSETTLIIDGWTLELDDYPRPA